jgi:hypothetical protein
MTETEIIEDIEEEIELEKEEGLEDEQELRNDLSEDLSEEDAGKYGVPDKEELYDRFKFLTEIRDLPDTIRTSNLSKGELGMPLFPVRFWLNLELYARIKGYDLLGAYLHEKAQTTTHTALSKEGFLVNSAITRRRETTRSRIKPKQEVKENAKD